MSDPHRPLRSPRGLPLVGHVPAYLADKLGFLIRCAAEHGDVVPLRIGGPTWLLTNATDIRHVLVGNSANYDKTPRLSSPRGKRLWGAGLLTRSGAEHMRQRRLLQPRFSQRVVERFGEVIIDRVRKTIDSWRGQGQLDLAVEMERLTRAVILGVLFGIDFEDPGDEVARAVGVHRAWIEHMYRSLLPRPELWPSATVRAYRAALRTIDRVTFEEIRKRRNRTDVGDDLLSQFVAAKHPDGSRMDDAAVRDETVTLMSTGYETIGDALSWTWYLLARHPWAAERMRSEIADVVGSRFPRPDDAGGLHYTRRVFAEAMRLYPPTWIFVRIAREADTLPSGAAIPRGGKIYLCQYVVHRRPEYFPEPERFDPERFDDRNERSRPQFAYFPFGGGPRVCIGETLARQEAVMVLASLATRFEFELLCPDEIAPVPGITLRPKGGVPVRVKPREAMDGSLAAAAGPTSRPSD